MFHVTWTLKIKCVKECTCSNGTPVVGDLGLKHGDEKCDEWDTDKNYTLVGDKCVPKCKCETQNGVTLGNAGKRTDCTGAGDTVCTSCTAQLYTLNEINKTCDAPLGNHLDSDETLKDNQCKCMGSTGIAVGHVTK